MPNDPVAGVPCVAFDSSDHPQGGVGEPQAAERVADRLVQLCAERQATITLSALSESSLAAGNGGSLHSAEVPDAAFHHWRAQEVRACQSIPARRHDVEQAATFVVKLVAARRAQEAKLPVTYGAPMVQSIEQPRALATAVDEYATTRVAPVADFAVAAGTGREMWDEPCTSVLELPEGVPSANYLAVSVHGDSMLPLLHSGDTLLVKRSTEWRKGALVVAHRPDHGYVVKQVGHVTTSAVELTSFNAAYPSVLVPRDTQLLVGDVVLRWCPHPR